MYSNRSQAPNLPFILFAIVFILLQSCVKTPVPGFSYTPVNNPEAGDSIKFTNASLDATIYSWDFGDGSSSSDMNPSRIYKDPGAYSVTLTASNEKKSALISESITINDPTILGFFVFENDGEIPLVNGEVWIYDNVDDWNALDIPLYKMQIDINGFTSFQNLEARIYYIIAVKDEGTGFWFGSGSTPSSLVQNETIYYNIPCVFLDGNKKSMKSNIKYSTPLQQIQEDLIHK